MAALHRAALVAALVLCACAASAQPAAAQDRRLRDATIAAGAAAAADWFSTYHTLTHYHTRETNPLLRALDDQPGRMVSVGAALDAGAITAWNLTMGRKHPKIAIAGLWAMTAFRAYLTVHNIRNQRRATPR
jgi:hypothetical protein